MLEILRVQNIILIEAVEIHFGAGFHVLSGETGAGKSALLQALALVTGVKADLSILRQGAKQGIVEAVFSARCDEAWRQLLEAAELSWHPDEKIVLRRELSISGKTRAFYNDQLITQALLKQMGCLCLEIVGQQASYNIRTVSTQRELVDTYGEILPLLTRFQQAFYLEKTLAKEQQELLSHEPERVRLREIIEKEREELKDANLQEDEEAQLIAEHDRLQSNEVLLEGLEGISQRIGGRPDALLARAQHEKQALERLSSIDPSFQEPYSSMQRIQIELQEIYRWMGDAIGKLEFHPERLEQLEQRLTAIHALKKRYGSTFEAIMAHKEALETRWKQLEEAQERQVLLEDLLSAAKQETEQAARALTLKRLEVLKPFASALQAYLEPLNMPKVQVDARCTPRERCLHGDEEIEIFFLPNLGEKELPIAESSGGELSRIHLALHMALRGKVMAPSIIFDEIDANIGGSTARIVGEMLAHVSEHAQVLCITHFPQVARFATHHLQIAKVEEAGRTVTKVTSLSLEERQHELMRMMGNT